MTIADDGPRPVQDQAADRRSLSEGVWLRGVLGGVNHSDDGRFTYLIVRSADPDEAKPRERRVEFSPFDPQTGQPSPVQEAIQQVMPGTPVWVRCGVSARAWQRDAFPTFTAREIVWQR